MGYVTTSNPTINLLGFPVDLGSFLITLGVLILVFFLVREILCWYWKVNKIVELLGDIKDNTSTSKALLQRMITEPQVPAKTSEAAPTDQSKV